jgi:hypothetical protein
MRTDHPRYQRRDLSTLPTAPTRRLPDAHEFHHADPQMPRAGLLHWGETPTHLYRAISLDGYLLKTTRPHIESDVNCLHADVSLYLNNQVLEKEGSLSCWRHLLLDIYFRCPTFIVPLDRRGGSVFRKIIGAAMLE